MAIPRFSIPWVLWTALAAALLAIAFQARVRWELLPKDGIELLTFDDSADGGSSQVRGALWREGQLHFAYELGEGFAFPYVGAHYLPGLVVLDQARPPVGAKGGELGLRCLDFSGMDAIEVEYRSFETQEVHLQFGTWDPAVSQPGNSETLRVLHSPLPPAREWARVRLGLEDFEVPQWWKNAHGVPTLSRERFWQDLCRTTVVAAGRPRGQSDSLAVRRLSVSGPHHPLRSFAALVALMGYALLAYGVWRRRRRDAWLRREASMRNSVERLRETTSAETLPPADWERLLQTLVENYRDPELSIEKINGATGFNPTRIAALVKANTGENFKGLLNRLRMERAMELMRQSDMQVAQVAEHCGYTNPTHFARVFKAHTGLSPRDYRREKTGGEPPPA